MLCKGTHLIIAGLTYLDVETSLFRIIDDDLPPLVGPLQC